MGLGASPPPNYNALHSPLCRNLPLPHGVSVGPCSPSRDGAEDVPEADCSWVDDAAAFASVAPPPASASLGDTLLPAGWTCKQRLS